MDAAPSSDAGSETSEQAADAPATDEHAESTADTLLGGSEGESESSSAG